MYISYPAVSRAQILVEEKGIGNKFKQDYQIFLPFFTIFEVNYLHHIFFENFSLGNWQKIEKSFGFGLVDFSKVSAETETSPKLLISAETESETEISVVHYNRLINFVVTPIFCNMLGDVAKKYRKITGVPPQTNLKKKLLHNQFSRISLMLEG